jgi:hypothetical protein
MLAPAPSSCRNSFGANSPEPAERPSRLYRAQSSSCLIDDTTEADGPRGERLSTTSRLVEPQAAKQSTAGSFKKSIGRWRRRDQHHSMTEGDVDYLETIVPGLRGVDGMQSTTYREDEFLTELCTEEELRHVLLPGAISRRRMAWDLLALALVVYTALVLPYVLAFTSASAWRPPDWMKAVDLVADVVFVIDVVLNFLTAYVRDSDATLVTDRSLITRNYLGGWFSIDAAGSVPWEIIGLVVEASGGSLTGSQAGGIQIVKILKVPKLLRLGRLFKFLTKFEGAANLARIGVLLLLLMLLIHWLSSIYYLVASATDGGWVHTKLCEEPHRYFTPLTLAEQQQVWEQQQLRFQQQLAALDGQGGGVVNATALATAFGAFTPGRGSCVPRTSSAEFGAYVLTYYYTLLMLMGDDVEPTTAGETVWVVLVVLMGACVNATIFANVASLVSQITAPSAAHQSKIDAIDRAMRALNIDGTTSRRIRGYFAYLWTRHRDHAGDSFIQTLPYQLRTRTSCMVHESMIRTCPLFKAAERKFIAALSTALVPEVYLPAQFIVIAGYVSRAMFFM